MRRTGMRRRSTGAKHRSAWRGSGKSMDFGHGRGWKRSTRRLALSCLWAGMRRWWRNRWNLRGHARQGRRLTKKAHSQEWLCHGKKGLLGDDDARFFALEFRGLRELAAKEFDDAAGAGAA